MTEIVEKLSSDEEIRLTALETVIQRNLDAFYRVGMALKEINERRLYRDQFPTWEEYCDRRWQLGRRNSYRLIEASQVVENVKEMCFALAEERKCPVGHILPKNEFQVRPLTALSEEMQRAAWKAAVLESLETGKEVTSDSVAKIVSEMTAGTQVSGEDAGEKKSGSPSSAPKPDQHDRGLPEMDEPDKLSESLRSAFFVFYEAVQAEKKAAWQATQKKTVKKLIKHISALVKD